MVEESKILSMRMLLSTSTGMNIWLEKYKKILQIEITKQVENEHKRFLYVTGMRDKRVIQIFLWEPI